MTPELIPTRRKRVSLSRQIEVSIPLAVCGLLLLMFVSNVMAGDASRSSQLESVFNHAGVDAHLSWVHETVADEAERARQACPAEQVKPDIEKLLADILSVEALNAGFVKELDQRINQQQLDAIIEWTQSDAGKSVHAAEAESINLDESNFPKMLADYESSEINTQARQTRLKHMLADTGAIYFLSAFNTEVSALVSMASVCSNDAESMAAAEKLIREERGSEAIYRSFMRQELVKPSGVVYQNVSDAHLDALSAFTKTDAGNAYYTALIKGTRSLLENRVDRLREALETIPSTD